jgi:hypothetical protein
MNSGQEEGANRSMYENIIRAFDWKRWEKPRKTSVSSTKQNME